MKSNDKRVLNTQYFIKICNQMKRKDSPKRVRVLSDGLHFIWYPI